jgi:hypothetical protein
VNVLFQENAWVDTATAVKIAAIYRQDPAFCTDRPRLLIGDNLDAHCSDKFKEAIDRVGDLVFLPPNVTDLLQTSKWVGLACVAFFDSPVSD